MGLKNLIKETRLYKKYRAVKKSAMDDEKYFAAKLNDYLAVHKDLKPLPQDHKEAVLAYWGRYLKPLMEKKGGG